MTETRLYVRTNLARALQHTVRVRGYDVFEELVGDPHWSIVSLALGGPRLSREQSEICDAVGNIIGLAEPRIWPLKLTRLIGSYGRSFGGIAGGFSVLDGAIIGPNAAHAAAEFLVEAAGGHDTDQGRFASIERAIDEGMRSGTPIPGFGVVGREIDERCVAINRWRAENVTESGPYWRMYEHGVEYALQRYSAQPNTIGPVAAFLLDFGLESDVAALFTSALVYWAFIGNALEARRESPELVRRLPAEFVRYKGPAPRRSPRAMAADE